MTVFPGGSPCGAALTVHGVVFRPARSADLPFLRRLYRFSRDRELAALNWPEALLRDFCRSQFEAQHQDYIHRYPTACFLVLELRREPVGRLYIDLSGPVIHLIDIALLPSARGRGIGTRILTAMQERAKADGKPVSLHVQHGNRAAADLYRRLGFRLTAPGATHDGCLWDAGCIESV